MYNDKEGWISKCIDACKMLVLFIIYGWLAKIYHKDDSLPKLFSTKIKTLFHFLFTASYESKKAFLMSVPTYKNKCMGRPKLIAILNLNIIVFLIVNLMHLYFKKYISLQNNERRENRSMFFHELSTIENEHPRIWQPIIITPTRSFSKSVR